MKLNRKGFMLAEVVIAATLITTILVLLYISLSRMSNAYETRNKYYDVDALFAAIEVNNHYGNLFETYGYSTENYLKIDENINPILGTDLLTFYDETVNYPITVYYAKSNETALGSIEDEVTNDYFKEYIEYLKENIEFSQYTYLIIIEMQKDKENPDSLYYYTLKVGDENGA